VTVTAPVHLTLCELKAARDLLPKDTSSRGNAGKREAVSVFLELYDEAA